MVVKYPGFLKKIKKLSFDFLTVLRGHSFFSTAPQQPMNLRLRRIFYPRFYPLHLFSYLNS